MAVYTKLDREDVEEFLSRYDEGLLESFSPIEEGIENTNYLVKTNKGKYILTIYEARVDKSELPFFINLTDHLRSKGINCPVTIKDRNSEQIQEFKGKKAALISFLNGKGVTKVEDYHLPELAGKVARMHLSVLDFPHTRRNDFSLSKWAKLFADVGMQADELQPGLTQFIGNEIYYLAANWPFDLPSGVIHADIFPDNVFFEDKKISGIIDFYFACSDFFAYDLAIVINAWNIHDKPEKQKIFLEAYEKIRPLTEAEKSALPTLLRGAALRFLMTRLYDWFNTPENAVVKKKDPMEYVEKVRFLQAGS